jgi:hypothetical protein
MTRRHTYTTSLSIGGDTPTWEGEVTLSFTFAPGCEAQTYGPAERCYPAEAAEIDDLRVEKINGKARPWIWAMGTDAWAADAILAHIGDSLDDELIASAREDLACDRDAADEARAEGRREAWA